MVPAPGSAYVPQPPFARRTTGALGSGKGGYAGRPRKIQAAHDARLLLLKSGMCLSIHESWYLHKVKQMPLEKAFRQTMTRIVVGFGQLMSEPGIPNDFEMQLWYRIQG